MKKFSSPCINQFVDKEDADKAVNEMNGFYVDQGKKLTVRSVSSSIVDKYSILYFR